MTYRYVPILRWKRGERVGMQNVSAAGKDDVVPLFLLGTDQYVGKKATKVKAAVSAHDAQAKELMDVWGGDPLYIDASEVTHGAGPHPLETLAVSCNVRGVNMIPATTLDASPAYQAAVAAVVKKDKRGVALRVNMSAFASVPTWIGSWPHPVAQTDLIVDCEDSINALASLGTAADPAFLNLHQGNQWRTVTLCGTSMPENFSGFAAGQYLIERVEVALWKRLSALALPYRLDYGDYATVSTAPAPSGIKWGYPINVKYSLQDQFYVCRGVATTGVGGVDADVQLRAHANTIRSYANRDRIVCWGDDRIDAIETGAETPQSLEHWVRIAVNRHVEITRHYLP